MTFQSILQRELKAQPDGTAGLARMLDVTWRRARDWLAGIGDPPHVRERPYFARQLGIKETTLDALIAAHWGATADPEASA